jgi:hypothetical protein
MLPAKVRQRVYPSTVPEKKGKAEQHEHAAR